MFEGLRKEGCAAWLKRRGRGRLAAAGHFAQYHKTLRLQRIEPSHEGAMVSNNLEQSVTDSIPGVVAKAQSYEKLSATARIQISDLTVPHHTKLFYVKRVPPSPNPSCSRASVERNNDVRFNEKYDG